MTKTEVLNAIFASVFNRKTSCSGVTKSPGVEDRDRVQNEDPTIQEEMVPCLLHHLDLHKSMAQNGIHPRILRMLADVLTEPLSTTDQQSWLTGEVPFDWKRHPPTGRVGKRIQESTGLSA